MGEVQIIKRYLRDIREEQRELRILQWTLREKRMDLIPPGINYDKIRVQTSPDDKTTEKMAEACALERQVREHIEYLDRRKAEAASYIGTIEDPVCRMVMELYYLTLRKNGRLMRWRDVGEIMDYSEDHVKRLHGIALVSLAKMERKGGDTEKNGAEK